MHVIYANDAHHPEDTELDVWGEHAMKGTEGAEVIPIVLIGTAILDYDFVYFRLELDSGC